jgi:hypothetical protein
MNTEDKIEDKTTISVAETILGFVGIIFISIAIGIAGNSIWAGILMMLGLVLTSIYRSAFTVASEETVLKEIREAKKEVKDLFKSYL